MHSGEFDLWCHKKRVLSACGTSDSTCQLWFGVYTPFVKGLIRVFVDIVGSSASSQLWSLIVSMNVSFLGGGARDELLHYMVQFAAFRICYIQGSNLGSGLKNSCAVIPNDIDLRLANTAEYIS